MKDFNSKCLQNSHDISSMSGSLYNLNLCQVHNISLSLKELNQNVCPTAKILYLYQIHKNIEFITCKHEGIEFKMSVEPT